jgi:hypothetical protein
VNLAEWRRWWRDGGEEELHELLQENWDPFGDAEFRASTADEIARLARHLHEGAGVVDVRVFLTGLRHTKWPERIGRKWMTPDRRVAEKLVSWYRGATGEWI